jgi:hypothetical protein
MIVLFIFSLFGYIRPWVILPFVTFNVQLFYLLYRSTFGSFAVQSFYVWLFYFL